MNFQELISSIESREVVLSFSSLKQFAKSPEHFIRYKLFKPEPSPSMLMGSIVDCLILTPDEFSDRFVINSVVPTTDNQRAFCEHLINLKEITNTDIVDAFNNSYKKGNAFELYNQLKPYIDNMISGKQPITQGEADHAKRVKDACLNNKAGAAIMEKLGQTQKALEWEFNGYKFKGYIDGIGDDILIDMKYTDADPEKIRRFIHNNKTYVQLAMYRYGLMKEGINVTEFKILALDKDYNVSVHDIDLDYILYGEQEYKYWMQEFNKCVLMKRWSYNYDFHGKHFGEYHVTKPTWASELQPVWEDDELSE